VSFAGNVEGEWKVVMEVSMSLVNLGGELQRTRLVSKLANRSCYNT